ncbi:hypothetical protein [Asanoa iriomotensis]|uniref:DUF218 domain-containing protein n=1 Tax=Asanoa iriomotensis TaxID=234613 RepID=A0ABQ4C497_9ACTN|nr:hypothetical protein [Asanoa iriomotensis]GIF57584.1 hypothetical protein Air01nite_36790 [Asanoa iriomotensis]
MRSDQATPRVVGASQVADLDAARLLDVASALTMVLTLPRSAADHVDALVVVSGQGEEWRLTHAIRSWEANPGLRHLLVANGNPDEQTYVPITLVYLRGLGLRRLDGVSIQAEPAPNTGLQAAWIVAQTRAHHIGSLALTVSPYHLVRVFLTVLKALGGQRLPLIPVPVAVPPDAPIPETGATAYDLVPGEVVRILTYQDRGWVATPAELRAYLAWLWRHPILRDALI